MIVTACVGIDGPVEPANRPIVRAAVSTTAPATYPANISTAVLDSAVAANYSTGEAVQYVAAQTSGPSMLSPEDYNAAVAGGATPDGRVDFWAHADIDGQAAEAFAKTTVVQGRAWLTEVQALVRRTNPDPSRALPEEQTLYDGGWFRQAATVGTFYYANDGIDCYTRDLFIEIVSDHWVSFVNAPNVGDRLSRYRECKKMGGGSTPPGSGNPFTGWDDEGGNESDNWQICDRVYYTNSHGMEFEVLTNCQPYDNPKG